MIRQPIKLVLLIENISGFYRNYLLFGNVHKIIIILRTFVEITLALACFYFIDNFKIPTFSYDTMIYYASNTHSLIMLVLPLSDSKDFKKLIMYFNLFMSYFPSDQIYSIKTNRKEKMIMLFYIFFISTIFCGDMTYFYLFGEDLAKGIKSIYVFVGFEVFLYIGYLRFMNEFGVIYCFLSLIAEQLDCIIRSINEELKERKSCCSVGGSHVTLKTKLQLFDKWSAAYATVSKISNLFNLIFGFQITIMIGTLTVFYISMLYAMITLSVKGVFTVEMQLMYGIGLTEYIVAIYIISRAAQRVSNGGELMRRRLATLLIDSVGCEKVYKATRDLLRRVSTHPIKIKGFGSITVDMALLPTCIALWTSYTIIALQFNNIL